MTLFDNPEATRHDYAALYGLSERTLRRYEKAGIDIEDAEQVMDVAMMGGSVRIEKLARLEWALEQFKRWKYA